VNFTSVSMSVRSPSASDPHPKIRAQSTQLQTPTLIGCYLLKSSVFGFAVNSADQ
jgi:hypothetical protein